MYIHHTFFIISSAGRHLRFLPYLGNLNNASINMKIGVRIFSQAFVFFVFFFCLFVFLDMYLRVELLDLMVVLGKESRRQKSLVGFSP